MSSIKRQYQVFIDEMVKHGDQVQAYKTAYPNCRNEATARVNSYRLLQNATIQKAISEEAEKLRSIATQQAITELKEEIKGNVLSALEKRLLLRQIACGEIEIPVKKPVWDKLQGKFVFVPIVEVPDYGARIRAIEVDNKMSGDNAPEKNEITGKGGAPLTAKMTDEQFEHFLNVARNAKANSGKPIS